MARITCIVEPFRHGVETSEDLGFFRVGCPSGLLLFIRYMKLYSLVELRV